MNEVVYLGSMFSRDGRYEMDVERRIAADNRVNGALTAVLVPTLLYGSKSWVLKKKNERKINALER